MIPALEDAGFAVTDTNLTDSGWRESYIRPASGFGALIQLVDTDRDWSKPLEGISEEAVLDGLVVWDGPTPRLREER